MQVPLAGIQNSNLHPLQTSQSDYSLSLSSATASRRVSDEVDSENVTMMRTRSVDSALSLRNQFEGSSEDEDIFIETAAANQASKKNSTPNENSSARIREAPKRKTKSHGITIVKKTAKAVVKGRRKLRQTPELDENEVIDVE